MPKPTASVVNLGCRVNRVESDRISEDLLRIGFELTGEQDADLVVINTCAVTGEAEAKTRKAVRHALGLPRAPRVVATGCAVSLHADALAALSERVSAEPDKTRVAALAARLAGLDPDAAPSGRSGFVSGRSRVGVKVQDGCNNRCTYCIVWKARGPERSVPVDEVVEQVSAVCRAGIPEAVLTGVNLGAYDGEAPGGRRADIAGLIEAILGRTDILQLRLSSVEPMDADASLARLIARSSGRVAPFLHLPVQSGSSSVLRRMGRPYDPAGFERLVARIRGELPQVAVSGDLIVGFPGETDEEFAESLAFVERVGFSRLHVFRYSARPGTPAAEMPDQVDPRVMAERSAAMRALAERCALRDAASRVGTVERAVIEYPGRGTLGSFHRVSVEGAGDAPAGSLLEVAIMGVDGDGTLRGRAVRQLG